MSNEPRVKVRVTRRFGASPERVFDAWFDAGTAGQWLFATASGQMVRVAIDARVGGAFAFVDRRDGEDIEHAGEYLEIERPRRIVFTFAVPKYSPDFTRVIVDIAPLATGCELALTHELHPDWADHASRVGLAATLGESSGQRS
jgi:uncharacterized protein YndB with AHSA1/START domain